MQISIRSAIKFILIAFAMYALSAFLLLVYIGVQENPIVAFERLPVLGNSLYPIMLTYSIFAGIFLFTKRYVVFTGLAIWMIQAGYADGGLVSWSPFIEEWIGELIRSLLAIFGAVGLGWVFAYFLKTIVGLKSKTITSTPAIYITLLIIWQWILLTANEFGFPLPILGYFYFAVLLLHPYLFWRVSTYTNRATKIAEKY